MSGLKVSINEVKNVVENIVNMVVEKVKSYNIFKNVYVTRAGATVSSHCGRNTLGVLFAKKDKK